MSLNILDPKVERDVIKVKAPLAVIFTYENARKLRGVLLRLLPKPAVIRGKPWATSATSGGLLFESFDVGKGQLVLFDLTKARPILATYWVILRKAPFKAAPTINYPGPNAQNVPRLVPAWGMSGNGQPGLRAQMECLNGQKFPPQPANCAGHDPWTVSINVNEMPCHPPFSITVWNSVDQSATNNGIGINCSGPGPGTASKKSKRRKGKK